MANYFLETLDDKRIDLDLQVVSLTTNERLKAALKISSILFFLALASIFLPVLHFFLVPGFLIASAVTFWLSFVVKNRFATENLTCPGCQEKLGLAHRNPQFPLRLNCDKCHSIFYVKETASPSQ